EEWEVLCWTWETCER
nr:Chain X, Peptide exosite inhibitor A-183 [Escherichia coli]